MLGWFRRLAEVPGVSYKGAPEVDRTQLPGHDFEPTLCTTEDGGKESHHLQWPSFRKGFTTSASPATRRMDYYDQLTRKSSRPVLLQQLKETLELPGVVSDYHFAVQTCAEALYKMRREDPSVLENCERLCWLDIELIEAYPETLEYEPGQFFQVPAFERLIRLYEREGYLHETLEVAERAIGSKQDHLYRKLEELRERLAALEAEDAS